ncbi:MAG: outer membrane beta-barrel protein [Bacteroidia bacterium]|nr:outer membrane beta-barrel protein [Bacteroidia bacterium]MDW8014761.1 outer membrane beta-barrel protein [Bacteroidia bacterium]
MAGRLFLLIGLVWAQEERQIPLPSVSAPNLSSFTYPQRFYRFIVLDAQTQEALPGAYIINLTDSTGYLTDSMGVAEVAISFRQDTVWMEVRYVGYEKQRIPLTLRNSAQQQLWLLPEGIQQAEVVIVRLRVYRTEVSLLAALRETPQIATGLSGQVIERTPDRSLAQVLSRVAGVSVYDGKFLNIRGMGQRYNAVFLNNLPAPQTEPDSRGFDLTLIPASLIDQVLVYKSASAEQTADFGGGIVNIVTRKSEEKFHASFKTQFGYLYGTTGRNGLQGTLSFAEGWMGGLAGRGLPANFPKDLNTLSLREVNEWNLRLIPDFSLRTFASVPPNSQVGFHFGTPIGRTIWTTWTASYGLSFQTLRVQRYRYEMLVPKVGANPYLFAYEDWQTTRRIRSLFFQNWIWMPSRRHSIELNALILRLSDDETILREGYSFYQRADARFRNYSWQYLVRTLGMVQIGGTHAFSPFWTLRWDIGSNFSQRDEPDFRRIRSVKIPQDSVYRIILPPGATTFDAARFYSEMRQSGLASNLVLQTTVASWQVKGGLQSEYRFRRFWARWFSYTFPPTGDPAFLEEWSALPPSEAFSREYLPFLRLREGTNPTDRYRAEQLYIAPFMSLERTFSRWRIHTGIRYEYSYQRLLSATAIEDINQFIPFPLWLPFFNVTHNFSPVHQIRIAYNRTLNRPELRELAPFLYYDFALNVEQAGTPELRPARLHNLDLRYEWIPTLNQIIAVGVFYKHLLNPIETYILRGADQPIIRFGNAEWGWLMGTEVEARLQISPAFFCLANLSYVWSEVDMGRRVYGFTPGTAPTQARFRPLQSQAPYLVNLIAILAPPDKGWEFTSCFQVNGPRLWWVGDNFNPSVYEMPRLLLDLHWRQTFRKFFIELQAQDILNQPFYYRQDTDQNGRISSQEDVVFRFVRGSEWTLQIGFVW